jgi:DNA-directed RNA polymerase specialized sigma24 family protein
MLTPDQQRLVVECMDVAELAVGVILKRLPQLKRMSCELQSAAYEGICKAAKTYDKNKSANARGYLYTAARNAALREISKELNAISPQEGVAEMLWKEDGLRTMEFLEELPERYRDWLEEYVLYGKFSQAKQETNIVNSKKIKMMLDDMMVRLRKKYDDWPD